MRTAAVLLSYASAVIIKRTVLALRKHEPDVDIFVVDNCTDETDTIIRPALEELFADAVISGYALLADNINNNAFLQIGTQGLFDIRNRYDRMLISDGDIEVTGPFLTAMTEIMALGNYSNCAIRVDVATRPGTDPSFEAMVIYSGPLLLAKRGGKTFAVRRGGFWMRLYDTAAFFEMLELFNDNGFRVRDGLIDKYFSSYKAKDPAVLLDPPANELTHQAYSTSYRQAKTAFHRGVSDGPGRNLFNHDLIAPASECVRCDDQTVREREVPAPSDMVPASPEIHVSAADHPYFAEHAGRLRRAKVARAGLQVSAYLHSREAAADVDVIFVIGSEFRRIFFDRLRSIWFCPVELASTMSGVKLDQVEIDLGAVINRKDFGFVLSQLASVCDEGCRLTAYAVDVASVFLLSSVLNTRMVETSLDLETPLDRADRISYVQALKFVEGGYSLDVYSLCLIGREYHFNYISSEKRPACRVEVILRKHSQAAPESAAR